MDEANYASIQAGRREFEQKPLAVPPAQAAVAEAVASSDARARRRALHQLRVATAAQAAADAMRREQRLLAEGNRAARRRAAKLNRKAAVQEAKRVMAFAKRTGR